MRNLSYAESTLIVADRHIADARRSIAAQTARVGQWKDWGFDAKVPEELLDLMEQTLTAFLTHRSLIVDEIERQRRATRIKQQQR